MLQARLPSIMLITNEYEKGKNMKTVKNINIIMISLVLLMSATFCAPLIANAETNKNDIIDGIDIESAIEDTGEKEQDFKTALEAIAFAQNKLANKVNYESEVTSQISIDPHIVGIDIKADFDSKTIVDSNGNGYSLDVCNAYYSWLNGQYGLETYFQKDGKNVKYRQTKDVSTTSGIATFSGDFVDLTRSDAENEFGYIDNSNLVIITKENIRQITGFQKYDNYYKASVKLNFATAKEVKQKLYKCGGLEKLPVIRNFEVIMMIDKFGNIISSVYDISCAAVKRIDYDPLYIHKNLDVDLNAVLTHKYNYNSGKVVKIPE